MKQTDDASGAYPGEFEVLRTKAEAGFWDSGTLVLTNYRVRWTPARLAKTPAFEFDLEDIASVTQTRLPTYLFMSVSLRFRLRSGAIYEIHRPEEDVNRLQHLVDDYRKRERYQPGALFGGDRA